MAHTHNTHYLYIRLTRLGEMMQLRKHELNCQESSDIDRTYNLVEVEISKNSNRYTGIFNEAKRLAENVNSFAANNAGDRNTDRKLIDAFSGLLAEAAWLEFLNKELGSGTASETKFEQASNQVDIRLNNNCLCEVRSSFARNGVKFALCNERYNFKNIGPYSNNIKPGEIEKDYYMGAIFPGDKNNLLSQTKIVFYLVGGSTWDMMVNCGIDTNLCANNGDVAQDGNYRVVFYKDTLDPYQLVDVIRGINACWI